MNSKKTILTLTGVFLSLFALFLTYRFTTSRRENKSEITEIPSKISPRDLDRNVQDEKEKTTVVPPAQSPAVEDGKIAGEESARPNASSANDPREAARFTWKPRDFALLNKNERAFYSGLGPLNLKGKQEIAGFVEATSENIANLNRTLQAISVPPISNNIMPPIFRADGSRYSSRQLILAGMPSAAIKDDDQRAAYDQLLAERRKNNELKKWVIQATALQGSMQFFFSKEVRNLVLRNLLPREAADRALSKIQN